MYLVLRVCREPVIIAGPRNAHRRPLIPPLAILFSSLLARSPLCTPPVLPDGHHFSRGPSRECPPPPAPTPLSRLARSRFFFSSPTGARPMALRRRSIIIIRLSQLDLGMRRRTSPLPQRVFRSHIPNSVAIDCGLIDETAAGLTCANFSISSRAGKLTRIYYRNAR